MIKLVPGEDFYRNDRIIRVLTKVNREYLSNYLLSLDDHEGCLIVNYAKIPPISTTIAIMNAWYDENECLIEIQLNGEKVISYQEDFCALPNMD